MIEANESPYFYRGFAIALVPACLAFAACDEKPSSDPATSPTSIVTPALVASLASAAQSATTPPDPTPSASAVASALPSATPASSVRLAASAAASSSSIASAKPASSAVPIAPVMTQFVGDGYAIDYSAPGECIVGAPCPVVLHFTAIGPYHVNQEYSYKLTLDPSSNFSAGGHDPDSKSIYSKRGGDFHIDSEKTASIQVAVIGSTAGPANIAGVFKLSVCSDEKCLIDQKRLFLGVQMRAAN